MNRAAMVSEPRPPVMVIGDIERAVAADEQRIAMELVDTVIRDLFGVALTLETARPHVAALGERPLTTAIESIDGIIRTIRNVVFALAPGTPANDVLASPSTRVVS